MIKKILEARTKGIISDGATTMALLLYEQGEMHEEKIAETLNKSTRQVLRYVKELELAQLISRKCHYCRLSNLSLVSKYIDQSKKDEQTTEDVFGKIHAVLSKHNKAFLAQSLSPVILQTLKSENLPFDEKILDNILVYCENVFKDKARKIFNTVKYIEACIQRMWTSEHIKIQAAMNRAGEQYLNPNPSPVINRPKPNQQAQRIWNSVTEQIGNIIPPTKIKLWFNNTIPVEIKDSKLILSVQSKLAMEQINLYSQHIKNELEKYNLKYDFIMDSIAN